MNILIFGAGAIGCHIGYCMHKTGHSVNLICKGQHYDAMKEQGLRIQVFDNQTLKTVQNKLDLCWWCVELATARVCNVEPTRER